MLKRKRSRDAPGSKLDSASESGSVELHEDAMMVLKIHDAMRQEDSKGVNVALSMDLAFHEPTVAATMAKALKLNPDMYEFPARLEWMLASGPIKGKDEYVEENIPLELNGHDLLNPLNERIRNMLFSGSHWIDVRFATKKKE